MILNAKDYARAMLKICAENVAVGYAEAPGSDITANAVRTQLYVLTRGVEPTPLIKYFKTKVLVLHSMSDPEKVTWITKEMVEPEPIRRLLENNVVSVEDPSNKRSHFEEIVQISVQPPITRPIVYFTDFNKLTNEDLAAALILLRGKHLSGVEVCRVDSLTFNTTWPAIRDQYKVTETNRGVLISNG